MRMMKNIFEWLVEESGRAVCPPAIDDKFFTNGAPRIFPGNTIICPIESKKDAGLFTVLSETIDRLKQARFARSYSFLPLDSLHMTLFEGVLDEVRRPELWPHDLPLSEPIPAVTDHFMSKLRDLPVEPIFKLRCNGLGLTRSGLQVELEPADRFAEVVIRTTRDRLADRLGYRAENHDSYDFHIGLAYLVRWIPFNELQNLREEVSICTTSLRDKLSVIELGPARLTRFEMMHRFDPVLTLGRCE